MSRSLGWQILLGPRGSRATLWFRTLTCIVSYIAATQLLAVLAALFAWSSWTSFVLVAVVAVLVPIWVWHRFTKAAIPSIQSARPSRIRSTLFLCVVLFAVVWISTNWLIQHGGLFLEHGGLFLSADDTLIEGILKFYGLQTLPPLLLTLGLYDFRVFSSVKRGPKNASETNTERTDHR